MSDEETVGDVSDKRFRFGSENNNSCYHRVRQDDSSDDDDEDYLRLDETIVKASNLENALEHFCSTCTNLEAHIGRVVRDSPEPETVPKDYNALGEKYIKKPTLPATEDIPDSKIIQVWMEDENEPDWFYGKWEDAHRRTGYQFKLVFELPFADVWKYDRWSNVEHPALPAPDFGNIDAGTDLAELGSFKGRKIRTLSRVEISSMKRSLLLKKQSLEMMERSLSDYVSRLNDELSFRSEQLKYLNMYLGRNVELKLISKGPKAPDADLINLRQRVLYMAEEVGVIEWSAVGFDFRNIGDFDKWIVKPSNLAIIAPEPKCIVFLKPRRSDADYGDHLVNFFMNKENKRVYILIRNGQTIYRAQIAIDIPDRVFPEEEKLENDIERQRDRSISDIWPFDWDWKDYAEKWKAREKWYKKGFTDADFEDPIEYKTKEELDAAKAKAEADVEAKKANPKEVPVSNFDLERIYKDYQKDLKQYFFSLAFVQGVIDRTDIFGHLEGKVNVFTGLGLGKYIKLIYDLSESRLLEDKATDSLVTWLKSEALKVKVGDFVVVKGTYPTKVNGIAKVVDIKSPGKIYARMDRDSWRDSSWYRDTSKPMKGVIHRLMNGERDNDDSIHFYPWNLPMDKLKFYVERRTERDKYWDNLLVDLLRQRKQILKGETPKISKVTADERLELWEDRSHPA